MRLRFVSSKVWGIMALMFALVFPCVTFAETPLPKIASLDHCADQYALALADKSQIAGLSQKVTENYSFYADRAQGLPRTTGTTEEILYTEADVVIRYWGGNARMRSILKRAGMNVISAKTGLTIENVFMNVTNFSKAFSQEDAGMVFNANYKTRLNKLSNSKQTGLRALYLSPGGTTAGAGTFGDEVLKLAGLSNVIAELGLKGWRTLPLEALILNPPDVIIGAFFDSTTIHRSDWGIIRHPAVRRMFKNIPTIFVPGRLLACRTFTFVDAAEFILTELQNKKKTP